LPAPGGIALAFPNETMMTPLSSRSLGLLCALLFAASCAATPDTTPDAGLPLDPTGNWSVTYTFAPSCGRTASATTGTFTVTQGPQGYDVEVAGVVSTGTLLCSPDACKLSGTFAWMANGSGFQQSMNLTLDPHDKVNGSGTEAVVTSTGSCTYPFTVVGSKM
jgi:hypothetical protein